MTVLLDSNVLIALCFPEHVHAARAGQWLASVDDTFATCPITQGSLVRYLLRVGYDAATAKAFLGNITALPVHVFWPDSIGYQDVRMAGVVGHRQVTDAYLAQLARGNGGRLATFDEGLAAVHGDLVELIN